MGQLNEGRKFVRKTSSYVQGSITNEPNDGRQALKRIKQ